MYGKYHKYKKLVYVTKIQLLKLKILFNNTKF